MIRICIYNDQDKPYLHTYLRKTKTIENDTNNYLHGRFIGFLIRLESQMLKTLVKRLLVKKRQQNNLGERHDESIYMTESSWLVTKCVRTKE